MKNSPKANKILPEEIIAFLIALMFMQSTLTTFHHYAHTTEVGKPSFIALAIAAALVLYAWNRQKALSWLSTITLTVLAVSGVFWISGLRANFF